MNYWFFLRSCKLFLTVTKSLVRLIDELNVWRMPSEMHLSAIFCRTFCWRIRVVKISQSSAFLISRLPLACLDRVVFPGVRRRIKPFKRSPAGNRFRVRRMKKPLKRSLRSETCCLLSLTRKIFASENSHPVFPLENRIRFTVEPV